MSLSVRELTEAEIGTCFGLMRELRTHLADEAAFVAQVRRQGAAGYRLAAVLDGDRPVACAGYRITENLSSGRHLYVDDLVTAAEERGRGRGEALIDFLIAEAKANGCASLQLDSGVQRGEAHRFYFRARMSVSSFHFRRNLEPEPSGPPR